MARRRGGGGGAWRKRKGKGRVNGTNKLFCELPRNSMNGPWTDKEGRQEVPPDTARSREHRGRKRGGCCHFPVGVASLRGGCMQAAAW